MSKNNKIPQWALTGHKKPTTRREFLQYGLIPFAASTMMPNWLQLFHPEGAMAQAANCATPASSLIPVIQINCSGGAGLMAAGIVPMDQAGNPLASYNIMGLGNGQVPLVRDMGNAPFAGDRGDGQLISNILAGIRAQAAAQTIANTAAVSICARSRDDTSKDNAYAINGLIHRAGLVGTKLPHLGVSDSATGIGQSPVVYAPPSPLVVKGFRDVSNALGYTASLSSSLNKVQKERVTKLISDLNTAQARKLASITNGAQVKDLIECAGVKNVDLIKEGASAVDPRSNAAIATLWGINAQTANNSQNLVFATVAFNTLIGQAGTGSIQIGGCDYHGNARANTNAKDREIGDAIGRILQTASILNKPVFILVTSDGAVSSDQSDDRQAQFNSDRGSAGTAQMYMFNPAGRPVTSGFQIGQFTAGQSADDKTLVGNSTENAIKAAFANWCKLNNRMDLFSAVLATRAFDTNELNQVLKVAEY